MRWLDASHLGGIGTALCTVVLLAQPAFAAAPTDTDPKPDPTLSAVVAVSAAAIAVSAPEDQSASASAQTPDDGTQAGNSPSQSTGSGPFLVPWVSGGFGDAVANVGSVLNRGVNVFAFGGAVALPDPWFSTVATIIDPRLPGHTSGSTPPPPPSPSPTPTPPPSPTPAPPASPPPAASSGSVIISSPVSGSTSINAVTIAASATESSAFHLEIWDNGYKLGEVPAESVSGVYVLPDGPHVLTVNAIDNANGSVISNSTVNYQVAQSCSNSSTAQCNLDQIGINDAQDDCNPLEQSVWVANPCGPGVQGNNGTFPQSTQIQSVAESGSLADQGNVTLTGTSLHLLEVQGPSLSNVLFRGQTPTPASTTSVDSHWILDQYVYLPDPTAHQAFEMDAQYSIQGIWTKFYTECAFNMGNGTGYWGVFDSETGGWIFLNGKQQNGQTPPVVPCDRSQFAQPWPGSGDPSFTGWHHIAWSFIRNTDGTVNFQSLVFDGTTTQVNFTPNSATGGAVGDNGKFSALIQLDGVNNTDGMHNVVDVYVNHVNLIHTP